MQHALGDAPAATRTGQLQASWARSALQLQGMPRAAACLAAAHWAAACADSATAAELYQQSADAAAAAAAAEGGDAAGTAAAGQAPPLLTAWTALEVQADALLGIAQVGAGPWSPLLPLAGRGIVYLHHPCPCV
jgi:hypothetical protein